MDKQLSALLRELEHFGAENDRRVSHRAGKMLNITPDTGEFLALLIQATQASRVLEVGTSNGYSTLWLADAVRSFDGRVTTIELLEEKAEMARANFTRAGLTPWIDPHVGDAEDWLATQADGAFDFIFLDAARQLYCRLWPHVQRVLKRLGLLVVDNATSHAQAMEAFSRLVQTTPGYVNSLVPIGKGELLVLKQGL